MHSEEDKTIELISRYLLGHLSKTEKEVFLERLKDPAFQQEVNLHQELAEAIEQREDSRLKAMLQAEEETVNKEQPASANGLSRHNWRLIALATAATLLLLLAVYWVLDQNSAPSDIYTTHFQVYKNTLITVQRSAADTSLLQNAFRLYEDQAYEQALPGFAASLAANPNDDVAFFQANALMAIGRQLQAIPILQQILKNGESQYLSQAKWYLALAYLKEAQYDAARPLLEELKNSPFYSEKARALLREKVF